MKIRIKFAKTGIMRFIGHLDMMRYFQKVFRRAKVDNRYTGGFSPHQVMSFAQPLGVGLTSEAEYVDIEVLSTESSERMIERLNAQMAEGVEILEYRRLPDSTKAAMSMVAAADYSVRFRYGNRVEPEKTDLTGLFAEKFAEFLAQDQINITKTTKKGETELDIKPFLYDIRVDADSVFMRLSSGSVMNIRPEMVMKAFYDYCGIPCEEWDLELLIHRIELYYKDEESGAYIPMIEEGSVIDRAYTREELEAEKNSSQTPGEAPGQDSEEGEQV